jgi:hypothetical protein
MSRSSGPVHAADSDIVGLCHSVRVLHAHPGEAVSQRTADEVAAGNTARTGPG